MGITIGEVHHYGITVSDLDRAIEFWRLLLQREPIIRQRYRQQWVANIVGYDEVDIDCAFFQFEGTSATLELLEYHKPASGTVDLETYNVGNSHLCLVVDDLDAELERLERAGVAFRWPSPVEVPGNSPGEPAAGGKAAYLRDPDGVTVELLELPKKTPEEMLAWARATHDGRQSGP